MDENFEFQVTAFYNVPPQPWTTGTFALRFQGGTAEGVFKIDQYDEPFAVQGTVVFDIMNGARVYVQGKNSKADVEISGVQMTNDFVGISYLGGMLNVLDYEMREWAPYLLNCYQQGS